MGFLFSIIVCIGHIDGNSYVSICPRECVDGTCIYCKNGFGVLELTSNMCGEVDFSGMPLKILEV
jgi:hypothetical protein